MLETPCVLVNVQRGGPSTGLPTLVGQGEMMQARWGSHGVYEIIALSAGSPQELFDVTITAFNLSEKYRTPVLVMTDEAVGHMTERVVIPPPEEITLIPRRQPAQSPDEGEFQPYAPDDDLVPPMPVAGQGYRFHVTGLTHDERGYPSAVAATQVVQVQRLIDKIRRNVDDIIIIEEDGVEDAEVVVVSYGISARAALMPVHQARAEGRKVGMLKLVTIWPFPEKRIRELAGSVRTFVVPEINAGQVALEVERCVGGKARTVLVSHLGGDIIHPEEILNAIRQG
jgi:2-oxoglutarate ferredoxin oxidoreductase subunit alpha